MFKHILTPSTGAAAEVAVFQTALATARLFQAHLEVLHLRPDPGSAAMALGAGGMDGGYSVELLMETIEKEGQEGEDLARAGWAAFSAQTGLANASAPGAPGGPGGPGGPGVSAELVVETGDPTSGLIEHGRAADLVVIGRARGTEAVAMSLLQDVLCGIGRPMLLAAATCPPSLSDVVVIAWNNSPTAARAVGGAMPFIARARRVVILTVGDAASGNPDSIASCTRLAIALRRHNAQVELRHVPVGTGKPAEALLAAATQEGASLLVMGGYGHSQLREMVFGGFTQSVLRGAAMPVLMVH